jgi:hypothetical protein
MGSQLISSELIKAKDYIKLEENVRLAMSIIQKLRQLYPVKV